MKSRKNGKQKMSNQTGFIANWIAEQNLAEAKPEFEVKVASSKKGPIKVTKFMTLGDAKEFLAQQKKEGMNGIISKGGKPVKEEVILEELSPDEIAKEQSTAIDQFNNDMAKNFPKEKFTARAGVAPMGGGITFMFAVIPTKDAKGVDLLNAPAHSKFIMHLTDNANKQFLCLNFQLNILWVDCLLSLEK